MREMVAFMKTIRRLRNILLFLQALVLVVFINRKKRVAVPKKILVIQMAKLGDMVCTTPVFRAIKEVYPTAKTIVVGDAINKHILAGNPDVDLYIVGKETSEVIRQVREEEPDFACVMGPDFGNLLIPIFAGVRSISSFKVSGGKSSETRTYKLLLPFIHTVPYVFGTYVSRALLRLLEPAGIVSEDTQKHLYFNDEARQKIDALFSLHGITEEHFTVGISPTAGHRTKQWAPERFAAVADYLSERYGAKIIIIGGPADTSEADAMLATLKTGSVVNTTATLSIEELKALIVRLDLFMSVDTGPIYIAEAFDVPTIDIAGPIDVGEQPPRGPLHKNVTPLSGKKLLFAMNVRDYDYEEVRREVDSMTPQMVIETFEGLYPVIQSRQRNGRA